MAPIFKYLDGDRIAETLLRIIRRCRYDKFQANFGHRPAM